MHTEADPGTQHTEHVIVQAVNHILNPTTSWVQYTANNRNDNPEPSDTYDGADDRSRSDRSFGVVDDTCDVVLQAKVVAGRKTFAATARVFCGPPDFAPDRRPFCSLAEELIDRDPTQHEQAERLQDAVVRLGDLFQRVYETASLANLDMMRNFMMETEKEWSRRNSTSLAVSSVPLVVTCEVFYGRAFLRRLCFPEVWRG